MNSFKAFVIVLILISIKTFACLNGETKILKNGFEIYHDEHQLVPRGHRFERVDFSKLILELDNEYKKTNDINYLSDKGYVLIIQGKYDEALKLYLEIEKTKPNRYSTASNLGTLYELIGENKKAYNWIKKSTQINSGSHNGSEWLHLKILEAKIKDLKDVSGPFFIYTNFGTETIPKTNLSNEELAPLQQSLFYQLNERITFIKSKDKIISILLFELGNISKILKKENIRTIEIYELAKQYGYRNELINNRIILCYEDMLHDYGKENERLSMMKGCTLALDNGQIDNVLRLLVVMSLISVILLTCLIVIFLKLKKLKKSISTS